MQAIEFKLKQASAVLGISVKELQNLVQLKIIRPPRRAHLYWFDERLLLQAKVAMYLKDSLGSSSALLSLFTEALSPSLQATSSLTRHFVLLQSSPPGGQQPIEIKIPLRSLAREVKEQMPRGLASQDLPRGRRRADWQAEINQALSNAANAIGDVAPDQILQAVQAQRKRRKAFPEVRVIANRTLKTA